MRFISDRNIEMHKEYLNNLELKYSVFEKSYPSLAGADLKKINAAKIKESEKYEITELLCEILAHRLYFSSFGEPNSTNKALRATYGSEAQFLYELSVAARKCDYGFLIVYRSGGKICCYCGNEYRRLFINKNPTLAIDLCEHAYFYDYGFDKRAYILNSLKYLSLERV